MKKLIHSYGEISLLKLLRNYDTKRYNNSMKRNVDFYIGNRRDKRKL